jgi:hypothetical protein
VSEIWPQGLFVYLVHFGWATFFAILSLFFLRFYPTSLGGLTFTGLIVILLIAVVVSLTGFGRWVMEKAGLATPIPATAISTAVETMMVPSSTPLSTFTATLKAADATATSSVPPSTPSRTSNAETQTSQPTLPPTETSTSTVTAEPTPIIALIRASEGGGAFIREKPGGTVLATLGNGATVTIIPDDLQEINKVIWVHVFALVNERRVEGWMIQTVLLTATPIANWLPSSTPAFTQTP